MTPNREEKRFYPSAASQKRLSSRHQPRLRHETPDASAETCSPASASSSYPPALASGRETSRPTLNTGSPWPPELGRTTRFNKRAGRHLRLLPQPKHRGAATSATSPLASCAWPHSRQGAGTSRTSRNRTLKWFMVGTLSDGLPITGRLKSARLPR